MQQYDYKKVYGEMSKEDFIQALARISASALAFRGYQTAFENLKNRNPMKNYNALATWFRRYVDDLKKGVEGFSSFNNALASAKFDKCAKEMEEHKGDKQWWKDFINTRLSEINILLFPRWQQIIDMYAERFGDNAKTEPSATPIPYEIKSEPTPEPTPEPEPTHEPEPTPEPEQTPTSKEDRILEEGKRIATEFQNLVQEFISRITTDEYADEVLKSLKRGVVPWFGHNGEAKPCLIDFTALLGKEPGDLLLEKQVAYALEDNNCLLTPKRKNCTIDIACAMLMSLAGTPYVVKDEKAQAAWYLETGTEGDKRHKVKGFALRRIMRHVAKAMEVVVEKARKADAQATISEPKPMPKLESFQRALNHEASERYGADWVKQHVVFG